MEDDDGDAAVDDCLRRRLKVGGRGWRERGVKQNVEGARSGAEGVGSGWQSGRAVSGSGVGLAPVGGDIVEHAQHRAPLTHASATRPKLNLVNSAQS